MLYSVRMRASKGRVLRGSRQEVHISGAEGLYTEEEVTSAVDRYTKRAMGHPRGRPDNIVITVEGLSQRPKQISTLPVRTARTRSTNEAGVLVRDLLLRLPLSEAAVETALKVVYGRSSMRGAALVRAESGERLEPDPLRGIRVSRVGVSPAAKKRLGRELSRHLLDSDTVREALVIAAKVASCREVIAELCISDDPDYTTGYVASRLFGYIRVPHIKRRNTRNGGRVFFIAEEADPEAVISYLEKRPVLVAKIAPGPGSAPTSEITGRHNL